MRERKGKRVSEVYRKKKEGDGGSVGVCKRGGKQKGMQGEQENANSVIISVQ